MSIFASDNRKTIDDIPGAPGATAVIQKLPGRVLEQAQAAHLSAFGTGRSSRGWAAFFQRMIQEGQATNADAQRFVNDPLAGYDRVVIARGGITAWSFTGVDGKPKPASPQAIDDLDDEALEYFAIEIMKLTKPSLFQTADEREGAKKND